MPNKASALGVSSFCWNTFNRRRSPDNSPHKKVSLVLLIFKFGGVLTELGCQQAGALGKLYRHR